MSWSVSAVGKPGAVAKKLAVDFASYKCAEPEETFRQKAHSLITDCLAAYPVESAVQVEASGSQSPAPDGKAFNNLSITIRQLYGFVE